jgi:hypothetical protein
LARKAGTYFIGCASHRFNLATKEHCRAYDDLFNKINDIMSNLKNILPAAKLREYTYLRAKTRNATRWSSTFTMILRYTKIGEFLPLLEVNAIDELLLSPRENRVVDTILHQLKDFESVSKSLQKYDITLSDVRD